MIKHIIVDEEKIRLDSYLAQKEENLSRSMLQKLLKEEKITVNGNIQKASYQV